jgi:hypothetical protein
MYRRLGGLQGWSGQVQKILPPPGFDPWRSGPEISRKLRFTDYMTMAQDGGEVVSLTHWPPLPTGNVLVLISVRG